MKRNIFIGITVILGMLITINVCGYITNEKVSSYIDESTVLREKMLVLDEVRSSIVETSQLQKLYILTQKQSYKDSFDKNIRKIYSQIDDLYSKGYIDKYQKEKLTYTMDEFEQLSVNLVNYPSNYKIDSSLENKIIKFNSSQLEVLHEVTLDIASENEDFKSSNKKVGNISNIQNKLVQGVSSIITVLVSGFAYYFKTKFKIDDKEIEKVIDYLTKVDNEEIPVPSSTDTHTLPLTDLDSIASLKIKVYENEVLLTNANLLYKQSVKFQSQCDKSELILKDIDEYIFKLRSKLESINDYPTNA
ncbi:MAG: hypothetical protein ACRC1Y_05435, partial [Paraclostridium sp.]